MDANEQNYSDILRSAWKRHAELDANSSAITARYVKYRKWMAVLGVFATVLAVSIDYWGDALDEIEVVANTLKVLLILTPITISGIAAVIGKFMGNAEWLTLRAGAEEIKKDIYLYRTVLQIHPGRDKWLAERLTATMRQVFKSLGGQLVIDEYHGDLPPYYDINNPDSDPGFHDISGDEYMRYRLLDQRDWHRKKIAKLHKERSYIQYTIIGMGMVGSLLAGLGGQWTTWVAVTASIAAAFSGWDQLRNLDETIAIYSKITLELTFLRDRWESLAPDERKQSDFAALVKGAEDVLWTQSQKYIATMKDAEEESRGNEAALIEEVINMGDATVANMQSKMIVEAKDTMGHAQERISEVVDEAGETVRNMVDNVADEALEGIAMADESFEAYVEESFPDETAGFPDETAGFPDETAGFPDETAGFPDETAGFPDETAGFPDETAGFPDETAGFPMRRPVFPMRRLVFPMRPQASQTRRYLQGCPNCWAMK